MNEQIRKHVHHFCSWSLILAVLSCSVVGCRPSTAAMAVHIDNSVDKILNDKKMNADKLKKVLTDKRDEFGDDTESYQRFLDLMEKTINENEEYRNRFAGAFADAVQRQKSGADSGLANPQGVANPTNNQGNSSPSPDGAGGYGGQ